jgi:hypothetical protein
MVAAAKVRVQKDGSCRPVFPCALALSPRCSDARLLGGPQTKKAKAGEGINARLQLVMKSGKYTLGYKTVLKCLRSGKGASPLLLAAATLARVRGRAKHWLQCPS